MKLIFVCVGLEGKFLQRLDIYWWSVWVGIMILNKVR
jgi:hypothetical protein